MIEGREGEGYNPGLWREIWNMCGFSWEAGMYGILEGQGWLGRHGLRRDRHGPMPLLTLTLFAAEWARK